VEAEAGGSHSEALCQKKKKKANKQLQKVKSQVQQEMEMSNDTVQSTVRL
jgi:hypothetical protein